MIDAVHILRDTPIQYVPLQLTRYQKNTAPDSGHHHTREEIQNLYKTHSMGDILPEHFFKKSREFVKKSIGFKNALSDGAKKYYLNKHGNVVGVIGQAGVGKTTFSKILLSRILNKKENLYNADYIFYVRLRDSQNKKKLSLLDFLFTSITFDWANIIDCPKSFLKHLFDSDSVVIILDGFDEIDIPQFKNHLNLDFDMNDKESPLNFILGLLSGEILPKAKKIITSRPRQLLYWSPYFKSIFLVSIVGIDNQGQKQICEIICKNHEQMQTVWNYVQNQPELNSYCYVPIMAILIFYIIHQIFKSQKSDQQTQTSITQVLAFNLNLFICTDHVRDRDCTNFKLKCLSKLAKLAYEGIVHKKPYFNDNDLQEVGLNKDDISTFFTTFYADDTSNAIAVVRKELSYFSHLIWQEFFAAIHMIFDLNHKDFNKTYYKLNTLDLGSNQFEVVTKFLFGLCNEHTVKILKDIDNDYFFSPNTSFLKEHLHSHLKNINTFSDTKHIFRLASLLYELEDKTLTLEFSNLLPSVLRIEDDVYPKDVLPLCKLIRARQLDLEIHLRNPLFYDNSRLLFFKEMESIISESLHIKVKIYSICNYSTSINPIEM